MKTKTLLIIAVILIALALTFVLNYQRIKPLWLPNGNPAERPIEQ
jgi:hypothetical protein